jgi:hypothetical protein
MKKYILIFVLLIAGLLALMLFRSCEITPASENQIQTTEKTPQESFEAIEGISEKQPKDHKIKTIWEQGNFPERLQVADIDMPLFFEGLISEELKQVILADLHLIFGHVTGHESYEPYADFFYSSCEQGKKYQAHKWISFKGLITARPKEYRDVFGGIVKIDGVDSIFMSKSLIQAYEKAWAARKADPKKYESFEAFIEWYNKATPKEFRSSNPIWLYGYDGISDTYSEKAAEFKNNLIPDKFTTKSDVRHSSILEFTYLDKELLQKKNAVGKFPVGVTLADGKYVDEKGVPKNQALFLYDGEKWYIVASSGGG